MTARTVVIGEALVDVVEGADGVAAEYVGGSPLNVAIGLARLGHPVELAAWIAGDDRGRAIVEHLDADGVRLVEGSIGARHTSTATATLDAQHAATYIFDLDWQLPYALPEATGHVHTGSIAAVLQPGASQVRDAVIAASRGGTVSYDPNARPSLMGDPADARSGIEELIGHSDVVKASDEDIAWLYGAGAPVEQVLRLWAGLGPSLTVATRGGEGALAYVAPTDEIVEVPGIPTDVVDTVGAGDSFMAALLSSLLDRGLLGSLDARSRLRALDTDTAREVLTYAARAAAITVSRAGANPPARRELD